MNTKTRPAPLGAEAIPAAPVLVRTDVPGRPFAWIDPTPHTADANGHVWTYNTDEPCSARFCLLCCDDLGDAATDSPCAEAALIIIVNECRNEWIAEHRVEGVNV